MRELDERCRPKHAGVEPYASGSISGAPCVVAVLDDRLLAFDLSNRAVPVLRLGFS